MPLPTLHINDIPDEGLAIDASLEASWVRTALDGTGFEPVGDPAGHATLRVDRHERDVLLTGDVDVHARATCVSCLEPVEVDVHADYVLNLAPGTPGKHERGREAEVELEANELDADVYVNDKIDVGQWVREQIVLELPAHPRCVDGCAAPIRPPETAHEAPRGIDPRLAPLQQLSAKKKE